MGTEPGELTLAYGAIKDAIKSNEGLNIPELIETLPLLNSNIAETATTTISPWIARASMLYGERVRTSTMTEPTRRSSLLSQGEETGFVTYSFEKNGKERLDLPEITLDGKRHLLTPTGRLFPVDEDGDTLRLYTESVSTDKNPSDIKNLFEDLNLPIPADTAVIFTTPPLSGNRSFDADTDSMRKVGGKLLDKREQITIHRTVHGSLSVAPWQLNDISSQLESTLSTFPVPIEMPPDDTIPTPVTSSAESQPVVAPRQPGHLLEQSFMLTQSIQEVLAPLFPEGVPENWDSIANDPKRSNNARIAVIRLAEGLVSPVVTEAVERLVERIGVAPAGSSILESFPFPTVVSSITKPDNDHVVLTDPTNDGGTTFKRYNPQEMGAVDKKDGQHNLDVIKDAIEREIKRHGETIPTPLQRLHKLLAQDPPMNVDVWVRTTIETIPNRTWGGKATTLEKPNLSGTTVDMSWLLQTALSEPLTDQLEASGLDLIKRSEGKGTATTNTDLLDILAPIAKALNP